MSSYLIKEFIFIAPSLLVFILLYILRFILVFGFNDWFLVWMGLELNIIRFIIIFYHHNDINNMESALRYFFVQAVGSGVLIFVWYFGSKVNELRVVVLRFKLGSGPFYYWFPRVVEGIGWWRSFFLMRFQKFIPLYVICRYKCRFLWIIIVIRLLVGVLIILNQVKIKRILAYSSIHHLGWIIILLNLNLDFWLVYLFIYIIIIVPLIYLFRIINVETLIDLIGRRIRWLVILGILSIGGIPPILGFYMKLIFFNNLVILDIRVVILLVIFSVLILYIYIKIGYEIYMGGVYSYYQINVSEKVIIISITGNVVGILIGLIFLNMI